MRKFGLIGYPLSHSFSQKFFTEKFLREGISDCIYESLPIPSISGLADILNDKDLKGLNVTIPYKEKVIPFLHQSSEIVQQIKACNCIKIDGGKLYGFNTDAIGFEISLSKKLRPHHQRALILGTGGAAKAVEYVVQKLGMPYLYVSRNPRRGTTDLFYEQVDAALLRTYTLVINTTPLGMSPNTDQCPPLPYEAIGPDHYLFDLIYNPAKTLFLQKGETAGATTENGFEMLILQAEESWKIWNA